MDARNGTQYVSLFLLLSVSLLVELHPVNRVPYPPNILVALTKALVDRRNHQVLPLFPAMFDNLDSADVTAALKELSPRPAKCDVAVAQRLLALQHHVQVPLQKTDSRRPVSEYFLRSLSAGKRQGHQFESV